MSQRPEGIIIAIDGPAAAGKSSTAKAVATQLGYRHLDSGAFYRALTLAALELGIPSEQWPNLTRAELDRFQVSARPDEYGYSLILPGGNVGERIRMPEVNAHVSLMAAVPAVRDWLLDALRQTGRRGGLVADGRDIGTVVFPDAELKIFLLCDPHERALRRLRQQGTPDPSPADVRAEARRLVARDRIDQSREVAPLLRAPDAIALDTTGLDFDAQVHTITALARTAIDAYSEIENSRSRSEIDNRPG
jgi:CMP/dCMP kinase